MAKLVNIAFYVYYMYQVLSKNLCNHKRMLSIAMQIVNRSLFLETLFNHFCCFLYQTFMLLHINIVVILKKNEFEWEKTSTESVC